MRAPSDLELEEQVVGAVLAGWLDLEILPAGICYRPVHERILDAVRCSDTLARSYEIRDHGGFDIVVLSLTGLDLEEHDLRLAERLATDAPVATAHDAAVLVDLARRRRVLQEMADAFEMIWAGVDIDLALEFVEDAALELVDA